MKNNWMMTIIVAIIVSGVTFFAGMKYQQTKIINTNQANQFFQGGPNGTGGRQGRFGGANSRGAVGDILSMDANSITIKLQDGSSKIINISDSTTYSKMQSTSKADLKNGERIAVVGTTNSDGSITAQNVQLNPAGRGVFGQPNPTVTTK